MQMQMRARMQMQAEAEEAWRRRVRALLLLTEGPSSMLDLTPPSSSDAGGLTQP